MMKKQLLIIDDKKSHAQFLQWILKGEHYQTFMATSFHEAMKLLGEYSIDLILLDLMMPEADGFKILTCLKNDILLKKIPVIVISAKNDRESIEASLRKGAMDYLVKPYNSWDLKNKIALILGTKPSSTACS
jgi:two-component system alkaline phosphatase synthesis response regulator PhoP